MFIPWNHESVRLTGRWSRLSKDQSDPHIFVHASAASAVTTAPGSYFEFAFRGKDAVLRFDMGYLGYPSPHLYIQVDGGAMTVWFDDEKAFANVQPGMSVTVGGSESAIVSVGHSEDGRPFALAETALADGVYQASVVYRRTQVMKLLFN